MLRGPLVKNIFFFAIPIAISGLLQIFFNAADLMVVGRFCGSVSVAAVGSTASVTALMINFFMGLSVGTGVTAAQAMGAGDDETTSRIVHTTLPGSILCGLFLTVVGLVCSKPLLQLMGTPEEVLPLATLYMQIYFAGMTFNMIYNFCSAILRAAGDTRNPLKFLTIAGIANVVLNVIFVTLFHMNVAGVALATVISQGISAVLVVLALTKRLDSCHLDMKHLRIYPKELGRIVRIGLPAGIQSSVFAISNVLIQSAVNSFGPAMMSGATAAGSIEGFISVCMSSFSQANVNFTGQNMGAKQYKRINKIMLCCITCSTIVGIVGGVLICIFARPLLSIYITDSAEAIELGRIRMFYVALPYFLCTMMDNATSTLRGMGKSLVPMIMTILGVCGFRIVWILTIFRIPQFHTPQMLYISYPISWGATFVFQMIMYFHVIRKLIRGSEQKAV